MATTINAIQRQPTELDYADPTKFKFSITKLPKVEFFTTQASVPGVTLGESIFPTPFKEIPIAPIILELFFETCGFLYILLK